MFEYFMPLIIMKNYPDTLLNETYKTVIEGQKRYAKAENYHVGVFLNQLFIALMWL